MKSYASKTNKYYVIQLFIYLLIKSVIIHKNPIKGSKLNDLNLYTEVKVQGIRYIISYSSYNFNEIECSE